MTALTLASRSPRRADLLASLGVAFEVVPADIDERASPDEAPDAHVRRLAEEKARVARGRRPGAPALGADTVVVLDGRILGKPRDEVEARAMLGALSGRAHEVWTGVALVTDAGVRVEAVRTAVWFRRLEEAEIAAYVASGEPMDKAGAYGIQGGAARFVDRLDGSYTNVVGLPVEMVGEMLGHSGLRPS
jgi:septum formation protein